MPVLFSNTAESLAPSLYASAASRYIFLAMKMSPRILGVKCEAEDLCAGDAACGVRELSRKLLSVGVLWAVAVTACAPAILIEISQSLENKASLLEQQSAALDGTCMPYRNACS